VMVEPTAGMRVEMLRDISHDKPVGGGADAPASGGQLPRQQGTRARRERLGQLIYEFAKFGVIGVTGLFITNGVYDLLFLHSGVGPVTSTTIATIVASIATYLGNRYWSFRTRQRTGVLRELIIFAVLNGIGLLIQDAAVAFNYYLLQLGHNKLAGFVALNFGIALATLFRFWSYRQFVWVAPSGTTGHTRRRPRMGQLPQEGPPSHPR
jgi:putative flippase GtrA